jgi:nitrate reductase molybdenum cofactor assembly chaperone
VRSLRPARRAVEPELFRLIGLLLGYPEPELLDGRPQLVEALHDLQPSPARRALDGFVVAWAERPAQELVAHYVATFDLQKRTGLYLTYYLFGDRRQRGMAFLRLKHLYEAAGWELSTRELPDYLPLMLEFAALAPDGLGAAVLAEHRPALELLRLGLHDADTTYAAVLDALLLALPPLTGKEREVVARLLAEGPPGEQVGLEPFAPPELMPAGRTAP